MEYQIDQDVDFSIYEKFLNEFYPQNLPLAKKTFNIYRELNTPDKKDIFNIVVAQNILALSPFSPELEKFKSLIETLENFKTVGRLEHVMSVVSFFVMLQKKFYEKREDKKNKLQTQSATKNRLYKLVDLCNKLKPYLQEVEDLWHPPLNGGCPEMQRNSLINKNSAIKAVYKREEKGKKNSDEINKILKEFNYHDDFERHFANCFNFCHDYYLKMTGKSINGYPKEKRAARSAQSREKTRNTMLNKKRTK